MNQLKLFFNLFCVVGYIVSFVLGKPVFKMGTPKMHGSGCPKDSVQIVTSTDGQSVSVLFSEYSASTYGTKRRERKSCNLAVPVDINHGVSIGVFRVDYRGNAYVPETSSGSKAVFSAEYYFAGTVGPKSYKLYKPGFDNEITIRHKINVGDVAWSPCGKSVNFRINTSITASKKNSRDEDVEIAIDSTDAVVDKAQLFKYEFITKPCTMQ